MAEKRKRKARTIGYTRVSTKDQDLNNQRLSLLEYARKNGFTITEFIEIHASSRKSSKQRRIDELLDRLQAGDKLIVSEISRLGRSVGEIFQIVDALKQKGIAFLAIKENIRIDGSGKQDLATKVMVTMFSMFAEIERDLISERVRAGLNAARSQGRIGGRPKGIYTSRLDPHAAEIAEKVKLGIKHRRIAKAYGVAPGTLSTWLKKHNIREE
jgi:DNA invertase Pin-like site-specific DNA recombinase